MTMQWVRGCAATTEKASNRSRSLAKITNRNRSFYSRKYDGLEILGNSNVPEKFVRMLAEISGISEIQEISCAILCSEMSLSISARRSQPYQSKVYLLTNNIA